MTEEQSMLVDWLLEQAELIPVTARGTEEISGVRIPFHSWAITTHGAVILTPEGKPDEEWKAHMLGQLAPYQEKLTSMQRLITEMMDAKGINAWARLNFEYCETAVYMVMKHRDSTRLDELNAIADEIETVFPTEGFYIHRNSNNVAWLPTRLRKGWQSDRCLKNFGLNAESSRNWPGRQPERSSFYETVQLVWHPASESVCRCHFTANFWRKLKCSHMTHLPAHTSPVTWNFC